MESLSSRLVGIWPRLAWQFAAGQPVDLADALRRGDGCSSRLVKRNRRRTVYRIEIAGRVVYLKHDHPTHPRDWLKTLWRCKARVECAAAVSLRRQGIPTAEPIGWGRCGVDSVVVTLELVGCVDFQHAWAACRQVDGRRRGFLDGLSGFLTRLAAAGVRHPDMHVGNLAVRSSDDQVEFFLLDVYGVKVGGRRSLGAALPLFYWLNGWACELTVGEIEAFFAPLAGQLAGGEVGGVIAAWLAGARLAAIRRWPGLRRRFLHSSSLAGQVSRADGRWLTLADLSVEQATAAVVEHRRQLAAGQWLKNDCKRRLTRVVVGDRHLVVKEFMAPRGWGRWRTDARCWLRTCRLFHQGFEVAAPLAWLRGADGRGYVLLAEAGVDNLPNVLRRSDADRQAYLLAAAARLLASLHNHGICHGDGKTTNFVVPASVSEGPAGAVGVDVAVATTGAGESAGAGQATAGLAPVCLVDCDSATFHRGLPEARLTAEFDRFVETIPVEVEGEARAAAAVAYQAWRTLSRME